MPLPPEPPVVTPRDLADAYALLAAESYRPLAGGTDLMVQISGEQGEPPERILNIWGLDELRGIGVEPGRLVIGALTTYAELRQSSDVEDYLPALAAASGTIGAAQIQNRGTIGGNAVNASPAGDTLPILLAADAELVVGSVRGERAIAAADFWPSYRRTALAPDELLLRIAFPIVDGRHVRFRKVGTRRAQAISKVVMAIAWDRRDEPGWRNVRVALGSMAATPVRARRAEAVLERSEPTQETADRAAAALIEEVAPIDDVRSTADYRRAVAGWVLYRLIRDEGGW
ncbi:MAG TPA: FAD binding domain-containing protein [Candidatus Limnocylindria bacterium]